MLKLAYMETSESFFISRGDWQHTKVTWTEQCHTDAATFATVITYLLLSVHTIWQSLQYVLLLPGSHTVPIMIHALQSGLQPSFVLALTKSVNVTFGPRWAKTNLSTHTQEALRPRT